jgi:hypothetical protein
MQTYQKFDETVDHIISACPILEKNSTQKDMIECVPKYTSTYARKRGESWTNNIALYMYQNQ